MARSTAAFPAKAPAAGPVPGASSVHDCILDAIAASRALVGGYKRYGVEGALRFVYLGSTDGLWYYAEISSRRLRRCAAPISMRRDRRRDGRPLERPRPRVRRGIVGNDLRAPSRKPMSQRRLPSRTRSSSFCLDGARHRIDEWFDRSPSARLSAASITGLSSTNALLNRDRSLNRAR